MLTPLQIGKAIRKCRSWEEFCGLVDATELPLDRGAIFARFTQLYLQTYPEYRTILKSVWLLNEVPQKVRLKLNLPIADEGIDLIADARRGEYWSIQSKYLRPKDRALTRSDLATFSQLSFVHCNHISLGLVAHTTAKPIRKRKLLGPIREAGLARWLDLQPENWAAIHAQLRGKAIRPKPRSPRYHQKKAIAASKNHFIEGKASRGRLIMPCATGKTLTAFWMAEAMDARSIIVAVPSLTLVKESLEKWTREYLSKGIIPDWLCVCSDESVGRKQRDEFVAETYDTGIETTDDEAKIVSFLRRRSGPRKIIFTTYHSSPKVAAASRKAKFRFDLGIFDEAHRTVQRRSAPFATLLFEDNIKIEKRLFMTATERFLRGKNDDVADMDDIAVYGERFFLLTFKEAIAKKIISDYRIVTVYVSDERIKDLIRENRLIDAGKQQDITFEAQQLAAGVALKRTYKRRGVKHAISFHRKIRGADDFRVQQDGLDRIRALGPKALNLHISSRNTAGERAVLLSDFEAENRALLTNARCLGEGVDVPAIDCVLFADPKQSVIDIVQAAGRALRPHKPKDMAYILIPLVVPFGKTFDEFAETTEFRQVARTISALSTQDERIAEQFRATTKGKRRHGNIVEIEGDVKVGSKIGFANFGAAIEARIWDSVGRVNPRPFEQARAFVHALSFKSVGEWRSYCAGKMEDQCGKLPPDIPSNPDKHYKYGGWSGMGDWLGTGRIADQDRVYWDYETAKQFVYLLGLKTRDQWNAYCRGEMPHLPPLPDDIPKYSQGTYTKTKEWRGWRDWVGNPEPGPKNRKWRDFEAARAFVHTLGLKSQRAWQAYFQSGLRPNDIPANPPAIKQYKCKWAGWPDWLGYQRVARGGSGQKWREFVKARDFVRGLGLKNSEDWKSYCTGNMPHLPPFPEDIPKAPWVAYEEWVSVGDWLGTGVVATHHREYWPFAKARHFARGLGLNSVTWREYYRSGKRPDELPAAPDQKYAEDGWVDWPDFLGTDK